MSLELSEPMVFDVIDTVLSKLIICLISFPVACTNWSMTFGSNLILSLKAMVIKRDFMSLAVGLLNGISKVHLSKGLIFGSDLSLQIRINGVEVVRANAARQPTPPRSPPDIPSTSSIMKQNLFPFEFLSLFPLMNPMTDVLFKIFPIPSFKSDCDLTSEAFFSRTS
ncbi:hypothetical protein WICPIJ_006719 [Wickerhamomyces pijperi]|uniref:Uncharacterized protein n=1 Tax=Wickerhamomyces pijperi TaxID=599730 RepID=A0A9P8Q3W9_WICPI|nr:hypothetical protein WICPIJ_006719 [Wickerhamomyces pijperi]